MPRSFLPFLCSLLAASVLLTPWARADNASQAASLLAQGQKFETQGQPDAAVELYRAAALLSPADPEPHRRAAALLYGQKKCSDAVTEYRAFVDLAPLGMRSGPDWDTAMMNLATCLRSEFGQVRILVSADAHCVVDGGESRDVTVAAPAQVAVAPGAHQVVCSRPKTAPVTLQVTVAAKETQSVTASFAPASTVDDAPLVPPDAPAATTAPPASTEPPGTIIPPPPASGFRPPVLEVNSEAKGWTCKVDDAAPLTPDTSNVLVAPVTAGSHTVTCELAGSEPFSEKVIAVAGNRVVLHAVFAPKKAEAPAAVANTTTPPQETPAAPPAPPPPRFFDFSIGAGFGAGYGLFGVGVGARVDHFGLSLGSGLYPFAAEAQFFFSPDRTGFYVSAGYLRIAHGLLFGGSDAIGHEVYGTVGLDLRFASHFALRIGAGGGYEFGLHGGDDGRGPLIFDLGIRFNP